MSRISAREKKSRPLYTRSVSYTHLDVYKRQRLEKEKAKVEDDIAFVMKKLDNPNFVNKAPEKVVAVEREKVEKLREHLAKLEESSAARG